VTVAASPATTSRTAKAQQRNTELRARVADRRLERYRTHRGFADGEVAVMTWIAEVVLERPAPR
jgi:hypothetical protein